MTCTDNKRWILDDNMHTLAFEHYSCKEMKWRIVVPPGGNEVSSHEIE